MGATASLPVRHRQRPLRAHDVLYPSTAGVAHDPLSGNVGKCPVSPRCARHVSRAFSSPPIRVHPRSSAVPPLPHGITKRTHSRLKSTSIDVTNVTQCYAFKCALEPSQPSQPSPPPPLHRPAPAPAPKPDPRLPPPPAPPPLHLVHLP